MRGQTRADILRSATQSRTQMPTFIDSHPALAVSRNVLLAMVSEDRRRVIDRHGVKPLRHWAGDGRVHCLLEAPDAAAVLRYHADRRVECGDVRMLPISAEPAVGTG